MKKSKVPDSPATIYNNMSHHYRRLFGARAVVDSHLNNKHFQSYHRAASTQSLNKLTLCDSNRPSSGSCKFHKERREQLSSSTISLYSKSLVECPRYKKISQPHSQKGDILDDLIPNSEAPLFKPRILKSTAESKLRQLQNVYFPPRKKVAAMPTWNLAIETEDNIKPWLRNSTGSVDKKLISPHPSSAKSNMDMASQCSTSSKDSAYNEGEGNSSNDDGSRGPSPGCKNQISSSRSSKSWSVQKAKRRHEDALYVKFLRDITDDILNKGVYTNKGLRLVFQKHINENMKRLNLNRMQDEVDKLSEKIGIPQNDEEDKLHFGLGNTHESLITPYARAPPTSTIHQVSKSLPSSSSLDLEKELDALEPYSDVELNEAEIRDTLAVLNIKPTMLDDTTIDRTKPAMALTSKTIVKSMKKVESNSEINTGAPLEASNETANGDSQRVQLIEDEDKQQQETNHTNPIALNLNRDDKDGPLNEKEAKSMEMDDFSVSTNSTDKTTTTGRTGVVTPVRKPIDIDLSSNRFKEINASLFQNNTPSSESNKHSEEIREELEENNYSQDDFEDHSDDEIEEDIKEDDDDDSNEEHSEVESVYSSEENF